MGWKDTAAHVGGSALGGLLTAPATFFNPWAGIGSTLLATAYGMLREQAQFQSDRETRRERWVENWSLWATRKNLIEGAGWGVGHALTQIAAVVLWVFLR